MFDRWQSVLVFLTDMQFALEGVSGFKLGYIIKEYLLRTPDDGCAGACMAHVGFWCVAKGIAMPRSQSLLFFILARFVLSFTSVVMKQNCSSTIALIGSARCPGKSTSLVNRYPTNLFMKS
jgi:hypothetical protein